MKNKLLSISSHFFLTIGILACLSSCDTEKERPNFILILMDDLGWDDLSIHGNQIIETPNIDMLARESIQLKQFYVNPVCAPTRASLLTGRDFLRTGVSHVNGGKGYLNLEETTIAELFKEAGYVTGMWGKWHSGGTDGYLPWERGFDEAYVIGGYSHENNFGKLNGKEVQHNKWSDDVIVNYAIEFIRNNKNQPFFAYLPSITCHAPLKAPEEYIQKYTKKGLSRKLATIYGMVEHFDFQLQRLLEAVNEIGLAENTVILFMSDNGPAVNNGALTNEDRQIRYVSGLKGHKGNIWENGVKSPLFIRWDGHYKPTIVTELADVTDILPTLLDIAGIELPSSNLPLDGRSIKPVLEGSIPEQWQEKLSFNYANPGWPATDLPWTPEGIKDEYRPVEPGMKQGLKTADQIISVRSERYKLLLNPDVVYNGGTLKEGYAMYDIFNDPLEERNIISENPETAKYLKLELDQWFEGIKQAPHSFKMPVFLIGKNGKQDNIIRGVGPVRISSNLKNTVGSLNGWRDIGDFAEYTIDVVTPGDYSIIINYEYLYASGVGIMVSVGEERQSATLMDKKKSEIGVLSLKQGKTILRLEIIDIPKGSSGIVMDKLRSIQLLKFEELKYKEY